MMPGMGGLDPQKMGQIQAVSKDIKGVIKVDKKAGTILLTLSSETTGGMEFIPNLVTQLSQALATQLTAFFSIQGRIIEVESE